jgi:carbonic anhydrase
LDAALAAAPAAIAAAGSPEEKTDRLCECNVVAQAANVAQTTVARDAWSRGQQLAVHGWIYGLGDGLVRDLGISIDTPAAVQATYEQALASLDGA